MGNIWNQCPKYGKWCREHGINNALQFRDTNEGFIHKKMGVIGVRMLMELRGISCLPMELVANPKKETCVSRSFSQPITELSGLKEAIASYTHRAAEKLGKQKQSANVITVFARTSPFKDDFYSNSATLEMPVATNNTVELLRASSQLIECIYRQGGVILTGLVDECISQTNLLDRISEEERE